MKWRIIPLKWFLPLSLLPVQMESGGTVLSTNWKDVGKRKVEMSPPEDVEFKKYWAPPPSLSRSLLLSLSLSLSLSSHLSIWPPAGVPRCSAVSVAVHLSCAVALVVFTKCRERPCSHFHPIRPLMPTLSLSLSIPCYQMGSVNLNNLLNGLSCVIWFLRPVDLKGN